MRFSDARACGLFMGSHGSDQARHEAAPLVQTAVHADVVDLYTQATLTQHYCNDRGHDVDCVYSFPLDSKAAVNGFEVEIDGVVTVGKIKEKHEAQAEYDAAVSTGGSAQLCKQESNDVFTMQVGNLRAGQHVIIRLKTIATLRVVEDAVEVFIPTFVAPRYDNTARKRMEGVLGKNATPLAVSFTCSMATQILGITSPTHTIHAAVEQSDARQATAKLQGGLAMLDKDLVLRVATQEPCQPRLIVEEDPATGSRVAVVSLAPKLQFQDTKCEFVFVVDRSGSMSGSGIAHAKSALALFLRSLPADCYFNIIGFGSTHTKLFKASKANSAEALQQATDHVHQMGADLGGTEILAPLQSVLSAPAVRGGLHARQVFLLTDGEVRNTQEIATMVRHHCSPQAGNTAPSTRCFGLGLGHGASRDLVTSVARAGRGAAEFIIGEGLERAVVAQLDKAMQPCLHNTALAFEHTPATAASADASEQRKISPSAAANNEPPAYTADAATAATATATAGAVGSLLGYVSPSATKKEPLAAAAKRSPTQAPHVVPPVFTGERLAVYTLYETPESRAQGNIEAATLTCSTPDGPLSVRLPVSIRKRGDLLHTLAARALIQDLEDETSYLHDDAGEGEGRTLSQRNAAAKAEVTRLGLKHGLVSKHTSYVAIQPEPEQNHGSAERTPLKARVPLPDRTSWTTKHRRGGMFGRKKARVFKADDRIAVMQMVKEGELSVEEAVKQVLEHATTRRPTKHGTLPSKIGTMSSGSPRKQSQSNGGRGLGAKSNRVTQRHKTATAPRPPPQEPPRKPVTMSGLDEYEVAVIQKEEVGWKRGMTVVAQISRPPLKVGDKLILKEKVGKENWKAQKTYGDMLVYIREDEAVAAADAGAAPPHRPSRGSKPTGGEPTRRPTKHGTSGGGGDKDYVNLPGGASSSAKKDYIDLPGGGRGATGNKDYVNFGDMAKWYVGSISRQASVKRFVESDEIGTFVVRYSVNSGKYILDIRVPGSRDVVRHIPIEKEASGRLFVAKKRTFRDVPELVDYYQNNTLENAFPHVPTHLTLPNGETVFPPPGSDSGSGPKGGATQRRRTSAAHSGGKFIATCAAAFDFNPRSNKDLKMVKGDVIHVIEDRSGWCLAQSARGKGTVPGNYLHPPRGLNLGGGGGDDDDEFLASNGDTFQRLVSCQNFDGSFKLDAALAAAVGKQLSALTAAADKLATSLAPASQGEVRSWFAAMVALAFLRTALASRKDEWMLVERKSVRWADKAMAKLTSAQRAPAEQAAALIFAAAA